MSCPCTWLNYFGIQNRQAITKKLQHYAIVFYFHAYNSTAISVDRCAERRSELLTNAMGIGPKYSPMPPLSTGPNYSPMPSVGTGPNYSPMPSVGTRPNYSPMPPVGTGPVGIVGGELALCGKCCVTTTVEVVAMSWLGLGGCATPVDTSPLGNTGTGTKLMLGWHLATMQQPSAGSGCRLQPRGRFW